MPDGRRPRPACRYHPQLAAPADSPPAGDEWLHEIKYDGYRIGACVDGPAVRLVSRNGHDWSDSFPPVVEALAALGVADALFDGEVAIVLPDGRTSFQALQHHRRPSRAASLHVSSDLRYFIFDLLRLDGTSLADRPLEERKARLEAMLAAAGHPRLQYAGHVEGRGRELLAHARRLGLEGIVSKRRDLPHRAGRHDGWLKTKCTRRQELVIGGFTDRKGTRTGLGALLVGYYDGGRLIYAGRVGTGFTEQGARDLRARLESMGRTSPPFTPPPPRTLARTAHWVRPALVAEVAFTDWTGDGLIRHPSFQGLRRDKAPKGVRRT